MPIFTKCKHNSTVLLLVNTQFSNNPFGENKGYNLPKVVVRDMYKSPCSIEKSLSRTSTYLVNSAENAFPILKAMPKRAD